MDNILSNLQAILEQWFIWNYIDNCRLFNWPVVESEI